MEERQYFQFVFGVVNYRNTTDLEELLKSLESTLKGSYHVIVVNNYYDDETETAIKETAQKYGCDFIHSENKGYGCGNNIAADYALNNYDFEYFVVSNPDIIIEDMDIEALEGREAVIAPEIHNLSGKRQNPMAIVHFPLSNKITCYGFKKNKKLPIMAGIAMGKAIKTVNMWRYAMFKKDFRRVYMAHGSFVIIHREALKRLHPIYDENMFLFAEEGLLAYKARESGIPTYFTTRVRVKHKEDGSMKFRDDINSHLAASNIYLYENYYKKKKKSKE